MHGPALFRWQSVNRFVQTIPEEWIGKNVGIWQIRSEARGYDLTANILVIEYGCAIFLPPGLILCVEAHALQSQVEPDLEEIQSVTRRNPVAEEHFAEPIENPIPNALLR